MVTDKKAMGIGQQTSLCYTLSMSYIPTKQTGLIRIYSVFSDYIQITIRQYLVVGRMFFRSNRHISHVEVVWKTTDHEEMIITTNPMYLILLQLVYYELKDMTDELYLVIGHGLK